MSAEVAVRAVPRDAYVAVVERVLARYPDLPADDVRRMRETARTQERFLLDEWRIADYGCLIGTTFPECVPIDGPPAPDFGMALERVGWDVDELMLEHVQSHDDPDAFVEFVHHADVTSRVLLIDGGRVVSDVVEGTAEEVGVIEHREHQPVGVEVARRERRSEVIRPLAVGDLVESFAQYQQLLPQLLVDSDYQAAEAGKRFVKKSGWRKIATAFDLDVVILLEDVDRDHDGRILRAKTVARATAPSGRSMDGDGYCTADEFTGRRANNPKMENDLRGTAATRAKNRAIADLVGMGDISAEEADVGGQQQPATVSPANDAQKKQMLDALEGVVGDRDIARDYCGRLAKAMGGQIPENVALWAAAMPGFVSAAAAKNAVASPSAREDDQQDAGTPVAPAAEYDFAAWARGLGDDDLVAYAASDPNGQGLDDPERVHSARRELDLREAAGAAPAAEPSGGPAPGTDGFAAQVEAAAARQDAPRAASDTDHAPEPGTVPAPSVDDLTDPAKRAARFRHAGCTCKRPLATTTQGRDPGCPIKGHGTPAPSPS